VNFLVGQVMQKSQGKADPKTAREKILEELE
jgi:Asp-tRNA(Asn)/Glu-tRNA(Gln) amidotransferase B subunit